MDEIIQIKLTQLLRSLSYLLDVSENRYSGHSKRTAYIAYEISKEIGLSEEDTIDIYYASLIHDIGMADTLVNEDLMDIHTKEDLKTDHCLFGYNIINKLPLGENIKEYILYHHEEWSGNGPFKLKGSKIPIGAQVIHLADMFEIYYLRSVEEKVNNKESENIKKWLDLYIDKNFEASLCQALLTITLREKFWLDLEQNNIDRVLNIIEPGKNLSIDIHDLYKIAEAFSMLIDARSKFTFRHTKGVTEVANKFAIYLDYSPIMVEKLTIAANLHDIGKFLIPKEILEKPGKLNKEEFEIMKSHTYYTKLILKQIEGIEDIAEWAANHHEKLNGKGYPEKLDRRDLTKEDQVIVFADIYQALVEDRPYRKGMDPKNAIKIMSEMAEGGYICKDMLEDFKKVVL